MASQATYLIGIIKTALRTSAVATAAGADPTTWALTENLGGRVFYGTVGMINGLNRGRLPAVTFSVDSQSFHHEAVDGGGEVDHKIEVTALSCKFDWQLSMQQTSDILDAAYIAIRAISGDHCRFGEGQQMGEYVPNPLGGARTLTMTIRTAF